MNQNGGSHVNDEWLRGVFQHRCQAVGGAGHPPQGDCCNAATAACNAVMAAALSPASNDKSLKFDCPSAAAPCAASVRKDLQVKVINNPAPDAWCRVRPVAGNAGFRISRSRRNLDATHIAEVSNNMPTHSATMPENSAIKSVRDEARQELAFVADDCFWSVCIYCSGDFTRIRWAGFYSWPCLHWCGWSIFDVEPHP